MSLLGFAPIILGAASIPLVVSYWASIKFTCRSWWAWIRGRKILELKKSSSRNYFMMCHFLSLKIDMDDVWFQTMVEIMHTWKKGDQEPSLKTVFLPAPGSSSSIRLKSGDTIMVDFFEDAFFFEAEPAALKQLHKDLKSHATAIGISL